MDGMKRNESFVFYLQHNNEPSSSDSLTDPNAFRPREGEQEISRACKMVIYYPPFSDNRRGILGTLYCTTLRLVFVPATGAESETTEFRTSRVFASFKYETSLLNICQVQYASTADSKKLKPFTSYLQSLDQVVLVKIFCKDFRIFTFDFKSSEGHRGLMNTMLRHAFPLKLTNVVSVYREFSLPRNNHFAGQNDEVPSFDGRSHWESELRRTGAVGHAWRVTHVNTSRRYVEGYPEFFVVPTLWLDSQISVACTNWTNRRIPVWCWSSPDGCALVRSSTMNAISEVTDKQWIEVETAVAETHPRKFSPVVIDSIVSFQDVATSYESLRKLCSLDSGSNFWQVDTRWMAEIESTGWSGLVTKCLSMTEHVVTRINQEKQSVIFREPGNSDIACVVSSLSQLCLDPYFRTINGFTVLLQKEWVALSHPFAVRLFGLSSESRSDDGMAPVFLLFLDCVWQLLRQFPLSFSFGSHYLIALWDLALTGLTRTFLFNSLRETNNSNGYSMRSAWNLDSYFTPAYRNLFVNPLYCFAQGLEPLSERALGRSPSDDNHKTWRSASVDESVQYRRKRDPNAWDNHNDTERNNEAAVRFDGAKQILDSKGALIPKSSMGAYRFWDECYLRWATPAQTLRGGNVQTDLQLSAVLADLSYQLNELRYLRDQNESDRMKFGQQLRHYRVQPTNLTPDGLDRMTSAFPFGWDTIPIPEYMYILPCRNADKQQSGVNTPRSALELATFSLSTPQAAALSCERLSVWGGDGESRIVTTGGSSSSAISRKKNQSVIERRTTTEHQHQQQSPPVLSELKSKYQSRPPTGNSPRNVSATDTMV